jgi:hypothetical protein
MRNRIATSGLLPFALLAACAVLPFARPPAHASVTPAARPAVTARALEVLKARGFAPRLVDRGEGVVVTSSAGGCRDLVEVSVAQSGRVAVTLSRAFPAESGCRAIGTRAEANAVDAVQQEILAEILAPPRATTLARADANKPAANVVR